MKKFSPQAILLDFYGTVVEEDDFFIGKICQQVTETSPLKPTISEVGSYWNSLFRQMCLDSFGSSFAALPAPSITKWPSSLCSKNAPNKSVQGTPLRSAPDL
jgi:hypothetical protein